MLTRFQSKTSLRLGFTVARGREEKRRMIGNGDPERGAPRKHRNQSYYAGGVGNYDMDSHDTYWTSWLVPIIVLANVAMFVVIMFVNNCPKNHDGLHGDCVAKFLRRLSFQPLRQNPLFGPSSSTQDDYSSSCKSLGVSLGIGAITCLSYVWFLLLAWLATKLILRTSTPKTGKTWSARVGQDSAPESSMEAFYLHLAARWCNSFTCKHAKLGVYWNSTRAAIWILFLVRVYAVRVGVIYLLSGIGGSILSSLFIRNNISVGASGALFGLLGAMLSELFTNWTIYTNKAAALFTLIVIIAINLAVGILPHVDNFAHIGGFLSGFLLGFILLARPQFGWLEGRNRPADTRLKSKYTVYQYVFWIIATILLIVGFTVGLVMLFKGENANNKCSWCHYLSCVPTSRWSCDN
ncbi:hypothetical protein SASPL_140765 [Salvia splendens]|uniref:RHOMBOID-like protein n=1 Tax=Salvia splendens TaxID=180675 RepID=A0A8X8WRA4_SALSN|nr:hypothetical protein SASPL_140765 [Salvia splendens]